MVTPEETAEDWRALDEIPFPEEDGTLTQLPNANIFDEYALQTYVDVENAHALPMMNTEGGLTAFITAYAAINSNARLPEEAFQFIELLYSDAAQSDEGLREGDRAYGWGARPKPVQLGTASGVATGKNAYPEKISALLEAWNEETNAVRFYSRLDAMLYDEVMNSSYGPETDDYEEFSAEICRKMQTTLSE